MNKIVGVKVPVKSFFAKSSYEQQNRASKFYRKKTWNCMVDLKPQRNDMAG